MLSIEHLMEKNIILKSNLKKSIIIYLKLYIEIKI